MLCSQAKDVAKTSLKMTIFLLICQIILMGAYARYGTYHIIQTVRAMPEIIAAVLFVGFIGTIWLQVLSKKQNAD